MSQHTVLIAMNNISADHLRPYQQILSSILATSLAEQTFSQIIDRLPIDSVFGLYGYNYRPDIMAHLVPCPKSIDAWKEFRRQFAPESLEIDAKVVQRYQNSKIESNDFKLLLLEIIAVAVHKIAVFLFQHFNHTSHTLEEREDALEAPRPKWYIMPRRKLQPTDLYHPGYTDPEQYPEGVADMVGYFAEYQLLGGVILFDRGDSGDKNIAAFVDPYPADGQYYTYQLSESQIQQLLDFSHDQCQSLPLPFKREETARQIEPRETGSLHIYRNLYDRNRKPPGRKGCRPSLADRILLQEGYAKLLKERPDRANQE